MKYPFNIKKPHPMLEYLGAQSYDDGPHIRLSAHDWLREGNFSFEDKDILTNYVIFSIDALFQSLWNQVTIFIENADNKNISINNFKFGWIPMISHCAMVLNTAYWLKSDQQTYDLIFDEIYEYLDGNRSIHPFSSYNRFHEMGRLIDYGEKIDNIGGENQFNKICQDFWSMYLRGFNKGNDEDGYKLGANNVDYAFTSAFYNIEIDSSGNWNNKFSQPIKIPRINREISKPYHISPAFHNQLLHFDVSKENYFSNIYSKLSPYPKIKILNERENSYQF